MCGITGVFRAAGLAGLQQRAPGILDEMTDALTHRGPDQRWTRWVDGPTATARGPVAGLGVRRLALVDVKGGQQPASDPSSRWWVCLNGEIYNHARLRQEVRAHDSRLTGNGEAELIAALVAQVGVSTALERLDGQFALSIVDTVDETVWLVRDRMGQKPLYWTVLKDGSLAWASELRALRRPGLGMPGGSVRRAALQAVLLWEFVPSPLTPWQDIDKLPPGGVLRFARGRATVDRWYRPPVPVGGRGGDFHRWARSVRGSLHVSVLQRLRADVEVGALLSGGLDSTGVASLAQGTLERPLATFGVSVDHPGFDEGPRARLAAAELGTFHRQVPFRLDDMAELAESVLQHMDEPLADSSLLPTWSLMAAVRAAGLKCVLSGDGADELFCGYPTTLAHAMLPPRPSPRLAGTLAKMVTQLPVRSDGVSADYMARRMVAGLSRPFGWRHQTWMGAWLPEEVLPDDTLDDLLQRETAPSEGAPAAARALHLDQRLYLADGVLVKVDRASMAHGVEVRSPFLDHRLVELAADIGLGHKIKRPGPRSLARRRLFRGKHVLSQALADDVPLAVRQRAKQGFGSPVGPWLRGPGRARLADLPDQLADLIDPGHMQLTIREHLEGKRDHRRRLWSAHVVARWRHSPWGRP